MPSAVRAHTHHYSRQVYEGFTCTTWLLTDAAGWLPERLRSRLINGLRAKTYPWAADFHYLGGDNAFHHALWGKSRSKFRFSREVRSGLEGLIRASLNEAGVEESVATIAKRFIASDFVGGYFDEKDRHAEQASKRYKRS
jgi:hypothetical protein